MKLYYLINGLGPGGAERSLVEMLPHYAADGVETTVICLRKRRHNADAATAAVSTLHYLASSTYRGWVPELRRLVESERPDLIHTTIFEADLVGRLAAIGTGIPVLTSLVNTSYDPIRRTDPNVRPWVLEGMRRIDGMTARRLTRHFHAITHAVKESAVRDLRIEEDRVTVIPRGRDPVRLGIASASRRLESRLRLGVPEDVPLIVNVARQEFQKGQEYLVDAMAEVSRVHPRARLIIVGREGHASLALAARIAQHRLDGSVDFLGFRTDIPDILAAADIFAFPSLYEGLGGAVIEAMALQLPVVASDIPALREVVEQGRSGYLVPPGQPEPLAERIISLIEDRARAHAMGCHGRSLFDDRYTIVRSAERMIDLYRSLTRTA